MTPLDKVQCLRFYSPFLLEIHQIKKTKTAGESKVEFNTFYQNFQLPAESRLLPSEAYRLVRSWRILS